MKKYSEKQLKNVFTQFNKLKVFIVGDAMLDNYWVGSIDRISPEAPVPVVSIKEKFSCLGGAANVALNCKTLGANVSLLTIIGKDVVGKELLNELKKNNIETQFCLQSAERITTSKTRVISRNQQAIRIDEEITESISIKLEHQFIDMCLRAIQIEKPDVLIFEDYNKGILKQNVIEKIITHCKHVGVITTVDPKKEEFFSYEGVTIFKPNLKEVKDATQLETSKVDLPFLNKVHQTLQKKLQHQITFITLSELGVYFNKNKGELLPAHIRKIADVSGAGDTVISVASMVYAVTNDEFLMAYISNLAGGLVCEQVGVVSVDKKLLLNESIKYLV